MQTPTQNSSHMITSAFRELMKGVYTSIPGYVIAFNPDTQRAQIQIGVQRVDVNGVASDPAPIIDVPVQFAGDGFCIEHEIQPGCEGDIFFSQRCIDGWKNSGGVANNPLGRFHDMQDAKFIPGIRSLGNVIQDFQNNGIRIRNKSGSQHVWLKNDGSIVANTGSVTTTHSSNGTVTTTNGAGTIRLETNGDIFLNGVIITPDGRIIPPPDGGIMGANGVPYESHRHNETGSITGGPIA